MRHIVLALIAAVMITAPANARAGDAAGDAEPRLVAATFRSAWCGACRILEPRIDAVEPRFAERPVEFVRFDFTWGRREGLREQAAAAGVAEIYDRHAGGTGYMLLIDREAGDVLAMITIRHGETDIAAAIERALAIIDQRAEFGL
ncbi:thiol reductase thioredoxin [Marinicauda salina]|uniref:Thiol reductase thioredoxin n=1 Tax=Marinicauda salina TaxID=2135793 RepID=A0A2U2BU23_9PROT|nr:thiol reductase thioredoxin [Marinicauda salina]PWE17516.1 thiol reductase thioredoxin [Marinicauda salina]